MSARTFSTLTVFGLAAIPFVACGGDDGNKVDSGIVVHDSGSGSGSGSNRVCSAMATYSPTFTSSNSVAVAAGSDLGSAVPYHDIFQGLLGATQTDPFIDIEIVGGGSANTPDWPGNLGAKSGVNLATAQDALAAIAANINGSGQAQDIYYATAGTLNVTSATNGSGGTFAGTLSNVTFTHGDFGSAGFVADPDGCTSTIANASFSATLQAPQFNGKQVIVLRPALFHRYQ